MTALTAPAEPRRLRGSERRKRILDAAARLFAERGFATVSVDAIGAEVGITGPAIYRHFARKQDLLIELLEEAVGKALQEAEETAAAIADPRSRLFEAVRRLVERALAERMILGLLHSEADLAAADRARIAAMRDRLFAWWTRALRESRPELDDAAAMLRVRACFAVLASLASTAKLEPAALRPLLEALLAA